MLESFISKKLGSLTLLLNSLFSTILVLLFVLYFFLFLFLFFIYFFILDLKLEVSIILYLASINYHTYHNYSHIIIITTQRS